MPIRTPFELMQEILPTAKAEIAKETGAAIGGHSHDVVTLKAAEELTTRSLAMVTRRRSNSLWKKRRNCANNNDDGSGGSAHELVSLKESICARLVLLALAAQIVVSFGHMHRDDLGLPPLAPAHRTHLLSARRQALTAPTDRDQYPASNNCCSICASIALLATGAPSCRR